jgi:hypothetical protein
MFGNDKPIIAAGSLIKPEAKSDKAFELLPKGKYPCMIDACEVKTAKSGGTYLNVRFSVISGDYKNRKIFAMYTLTNKNPTAEKIGKEMLYTLLDCAGFDPDKGLGNTNDLIGACMQCGIDIKSDDTYGDKNVVKYLVQDLELKDKNDSIPF